MTITHTDTDYGIKDTISKLRYYKTAKYNGEYVSILTHYNMMGMVRIKIRTMKGCQGYVTLSELSEFCL